MSIDIVWYEFLLINIGKEKRKQETKSLPIFKKIREDTADVHPLDIGNCIGMELDDDTKFNVAKNHWCPPTFDFPYCDFSSANTKNPNRQRFCFQWLSRWTWLCILCFMMEHVVSVVICLVKKLDVMGQSCLSCIKSHSPTGNALQRDLNVMKRILWFTMTQRCK